MNLQETPSSVTGRETLKAMLAYKASNMCRPMVRDHRQPDGSLPEWVAETIRKIMRFHSREGNLRVRFLRTREAWVAAGCPADCPPWVLISRRASREVSG